MKDRMYNLLSLRSLAPTISFAVMIVVFAFLQPGCGGGGAEAPTGNISGNVYIPDDGGTRRNAESAPSDYKSLVDAVVTVLNTALSTTTNQDGYYFLSGVPAGIQSLSITKSGYANITKTVNVIPGITSQMEFHYINFKDVSRYEASGIKYPRKLVIDEEQEWNQIWEEALGNGGMIPAPDTPEIDFQNSTVIAVFEGTRGCAQYEVNIDNIFESNDQIYVAVTGGGPGPGSICLTSLSWPSHIVMTNKLTKQVNFQYTFIEW